MATFVRPPHSSWFYPATEPMALCSAACEHAWRFLARWFCGNGFAWAANVARYFFSVRIVIAGSAIAASPAASKRGFVNSAAPIAGTSKVRKDGSIIVTGSGNTDSAKRKPA